MNVIVSNRQKDLIDNANIDAIKDLNGLFNVDDLINKFKNYYFSKMILDATSVVNFASKEVLTTLVNEIGAEKLIILLPSNPEPPKEFIKLLIDLKIYNFTNNIDDVVKFIDKPNTYEDVVNLVDDSSNNMYVDNSIKEDDSQDNGGDNSNNNNGNYNNNNYDNNVSMNSSHRSLGDMLNNFNINTSDDNSNNAEESSAITIPQEENQEETVAEITNENEAINTDDNEYEDYNSSMQQDNVDEDNKEEKNVFLIFDSIKEDSDNNNTVEKRVIGVKNITEHAGSTSLIYMMNKIVASNLKKNVLSVEIDKKDFKLYRDNKMISVDSKDAKNIIENAREEVIFVDLNEYDDLSVCTDVLFLVEPSTIKLNKLMMENKNIFKEIKNEKVILNKTLLSDNDIRTLSSEAGIDFFYCIEPLNDRIINDTIVKLLELLNIK